jgi:type IV secretory pathway TrbL component
MAGEAPLDQKGRAVIGHRGRRDAVEPENFFAVAVVNGQKGLGSAPFMTLACMMAQKLIQSSVAAIKGVSVIGPGDRLFMPGGKGHRRSGRA